MDVLLIYSVVLVAGPLALAGFFYYVCRGRPAPFRMSGRQARERRALDEIEWHLMAEANTTEGGHSRQID